MRDATTRARHLSGVASEPAASETRAKAGAAALPVKPFLVAREQIPAIFDATSTLRARPFAAHEQIAHTAFAGAALAWLEASSGGKVPTRSHHGATLLAVMRGRATLVGTAARQVEQGDVLTIPSDHSYGFDDIEGDLHVLQVTLQQQDGGAAEAQVLSLERLLEQNRKRAEQVLESPFYVLLRDGLLNTRDKRSAACEAIRVFSDSFQTFLFTRQAMCREKGYFSAFHGHLLEELGHNDLLKVEGNRRILGDPILRATSVWFSHQMLKLDNAGKTVVNLVLETSGYHFHTLAKPVFADGDSAVYFAAHAEADEEHMDLGVDLLAGQHPDTYRRLLELLDESWDMLQTVTTRFAELVAQEVNESSCAAQ
jgi:hypothetical protein